MRAIYRRDRPTVLMNRHQSRSSRGSIDELGGGEMMKRLNLFRNLPLLRAMCVAPFGGHVCDPFPLEAPNTTRERQLSLVYVMKMRTQCRVRKGQRPIKQVLGHLTGRGKDQCRRQLMRNVSWRIFAFLRWVSEDYEHRARGKT